MLARYGIFLEINTLLFKRQLHCLLRLRRLAFQAMVGQARSFASDPPQLMTGFGSFGKMALN